MVRQTAVTVVLVGLVMLGASARMAAADCFSCGCFGPHDELILNRCSYTEIPGDQCPECPPGFLVTTGASGGVTCNEVPGCRPLLSRAPALSPIPLAGLGVLLVGGGVCLTKGRRTRAAA